MDIFDLMATIKLDSSEYERGLSEAEKKTSNIGSALGNAAKVGAAGFAAATTAVVGLTKQSVDAYSDYEQLVGGVETLFGSSAQKVISDANDAFKTAGMSMNDYMDTSIQSAAALINSLGGNQEKAAELMNVSIVDMADNVNKMGTSMEGVQNAYRGFSRGNFTMLDNLALGFAGTKEGMQALLDKAKEYEAEQGRVRDFSIDSYADIVEAIHVVQDNMGIAGTTASEASGTIAGSVGAVKSAWQNLVAGFSNKDADLGQLIGNVVDSAETAFENFLPAIEQAVIGIGDFVTGLAPIIVEKIPKLISTVLPSVLNAATSLLDAVVKVLPTAGLQIILTLVNAIVDNLPMILSAALNLVVELAKGIGEALPELVPAVVDAVITIVDTLIDNIDLLIEAALQLMIGLAEGLIRAIPRIIERIPEIIASIVGALVGAVPQIATAGVQLLGALVLNLPEIISSVVEGVGSVLSSILDAVTGFIPNMIDAGKNLMFGLADGIKQKASAAWEAAKSAGGKVLDFVNGVFGNNSPSKEFKKIGRYLMQGMAIGIEDNIGVVEDAMDDMSDAVYDGVGDDVFDTQNVVTTKDVSGDSSSVGSGKTEALLRQILEAMQGIGMYINGADFVGYITPDMDTSLGSLAYYRSREGVIA